MKRRRIVTGLVATVAATALVGVAVPSAQAAPAAVTAGAAGGVNNYGATVKALMSANGFQALTASVEAQVHIQYPHAILGDIVGTSPSGPTTSITDVTRWDFNFNDIIGDTDHVLVRGTVFLPSYTATITVLHNTDVYSHDLTEPVAMSPFTASLLIRLAGYREPFTKVIYAQPFGRSYVHPLFIIDQGDGFIQVDTVTRAVAPFHYSPGPTP